MTNAPEQDPLSMILDVFEQEQEAELIARFGEHGFHIWRDAPHRQRLLCPTAVGTVKGSCGDTISVALGIKGETIVETDFDTDGCASSLIAAATAAALALGKSLDDAVDIDEQAIVSAVGAFPDDDRHCAYLAAAAVREAVHYWMIQSGEVVLER
ncbi:MAG: iron-sulfur cluster assembly scaffold protein [Solidesulfovibrio sp.]